MIARWQWLGICFLGIGLAGCVTETVGRQPSEGSPKEAAKANLQLGVGYIRQGDLQSAQLKLEKAIVQDPSLIEAHTALALVYDQLGDADGAEREYRRAVSIAPDNPDALNYLAVYLCRNPGGRAEALKYFDRAIAVPMSRQFSNKAALNTNAGVCAKPIDLARAEAYLRKALVTAPDYGPALLQLADVTFRRENYLASRAFLERYLAVAPSSPAVLWLGVRVERALGDDGAADIYALRLKQEFPESVETGLLLEQERNAG